MIIKLISLNLYIIQFYSIAALSCPADIDSLTSTASWLAPNAEGFPGGIDIQYLKNGVPITTNTNQNMIEYVHFDLGQTSMVTARATDIFGNSAQCTFLVTVTPGMYGRYCKLILK